MFPFLKKTQMILHPICLFWKLPNFSKATYIFEKNVGLADEEAPDLSAFKIIESTDK